MSELLTSPHLTVQPLGFPLVRGTVWIRILPLKEISVLPLLGIITFESPLSFKCRMSYSFQQSIIKYIFLIYFSMELFSDDSEHTNTFHLDRAKTVTILSIKKCHLHE